MLFRIAISLIAVIFLAGQGSAQRGFPGSEPPGQYPAEAYYTGLELYRDGDVVAALEFFDAALSQGRKTSDGLWIDSIAPLAMRSECLFQLGDCVGSLESIELLMSLSKANSRWLSRVVWDTMVNEGSVAQPKQWLWPAAAGIKRIPLRRSVQFESGTVVTEQVIARGGTIEPFNVKLLDITETMRGIATAMHRRRILLGPLSTDDPSVIGLLDSIKYPARLNLPLARSMIGCMRGCGYFAAGNDEKTYAGVGSAMVAGSVHDLSPIVLLSALSASATQDDVTPKIEGAIRAANIAAAADQIEWIGPALQLAAGYSDAATAGEVATVASGIATALARRGRLASLHAAVAAADAYVTAGQIEAAAGMLQSAGQLSARRDVYCPRVEAYAAWVAARLAAANSTGVNGGSMKLPGRTSPAAIAEMMDPAVATALDRLNTFAAGKIQLPRDRRRNARGPVVTLPRVLQQKRLPALLAAAGTSSAADALVSVYIGDPPRWLWRIDPVDALGSATQDRTPLHRIRLSMAMSVGNAEDLWRATNDYSIDRFYTRMPIGGRAASVRKLSWTPRDLLDEPSRNFIDSHEPMKALRTAVDAAGGQPDAAPRLRAAANRIALSPIHIPAALLPTLDTKKPTDGFAPGDAVLAMVEVDQAFQFLLMSQGRLLQWRMPSPPIKRSLADYLDAIGVTRSRMRLPGNPKDTTTRRESLIRLTRSMFPDDALWQSVDQERLLIVPDGVLWYLPFELLLADLRTSDPKEIPDSELTLGDRLTIRYMPSIGCGRFVGGPIAAENSVALAADLFFAPRDLENNDAVIADIGRIDGVDLEAVRSMPSPRIGSKSGHLVVAAARVLPPADPLSMPPSSTDPPRVGSRLAAFLSFPHSPPQSVALLGLRTGVTGGGDGSEIFDCLATLRVAGVRHAMISRWAVGGESTAGLTKDYIAELRSTSAAEAMDRSRTLLRQREILPSAEPLLGRAEAEREDITGDEPLFWAGYLISS